MSFDFNGSGYIQRELALPADANNFAACGVARIEAANTNPGCIFEIHLPDTSQHFFGSKAGSSTTVVAFCNYGTQSSGDIWTPGTNTDFFWAITNDDGEFTIALKLLTSSTWDATWTAPDPTTTFAPDRIAVGGNLYTPDENFNGKIGIIKVWDAPLSLTDLLAQSFQLTPITTTDLLSSHLTDGPDVAADLVADIGGADADWDSYGSGTTYAAPPTLSVPKSLTASGVVAAVGVGSVALNTSAPSIAKGGTLAVTATVLGTDGLPFEGISVALSSATTANVTVASSPVTTDAAGEADFTLNGVEVGTSVLTANADSGGATSTATASVTSAVSVAVLTIAAPVIAAAGGTTPVTVLAYGNDGQPMSGVSVSLTSGTTGVATIASSPQSTNGSGVATFTLNGVAQGISILTASAASGAVTDTEIASVQATVVPSASGQSSPWAKLLLRP